MRGMPIHCVFVLAIFTIAGCSNSDPVENAYVNKTEAFVRAELGSPYREAVGHYGLPPISFTNQFSGEIKTLVFKKAGGEIYVSFEKRPDGWIGICSSWLPKGAAF